MLLLLACTPTTEDTGTPDPLSWSVDQDGPYNVGFRLLELTYAPTGRDEPRSIVVNLWYPTQDSSGSSGIYYEAFEDDRVIRDAELAPMAHAESYPVHIHSHGYSGYGASSAFLMRRYASHGWVVAAPEHTGNTIGEHTDDLPTWFYWVRIEDLSATFDAVAQEIPQVSDVGLVSGHSFGGYTAFHAAGAGLDQEKWAQECEAAGDCDDNDLERFEQGVSDPRFKAALPLAGAGWGSIGAEGYEQLEVPVLMMTGSDDGSGDQTKIWEETSVSPLTWVHIEGACHQTFALGGCSDLDTEQGYGIVSTYGLALGRSAILGDGAMDGLLDGTEVLDEGAEVLAR